MNTKTLVALSLLACLLGTPAFAADAEGEVAPLRLPSPPSLGEERAVDLVIALDTSNSMDALLDSARARIWDIVNLLARMEPTPELRVGLLTYGSPIPEAEENGWVIKHAELTDDLDAVYADLMALRTSGGSEYVGWVLQEAVDTMDWSPDPSGLRLVFLAGNESADQASDEVNFRDVARNAADDDIIINAVYAGAREVALVEKWDEVARHGRGNFSSIDMRAGLFQVATPQDQVLIDLNAELNGTYLPYGENGAAGLANQVAQDSNATRLGVQSCSSRIVAKGTSLYTNASWDLVDATLEDGFQWAALRDEDLPEVLRPLSRDQRQAHVDERRAERERIQERIQTVSAEREIFLRKARAEAFGDGSSLDDAMREALLATAREKGFRCGGC